MGLVLKYVSKRRELDFQNEIMNCSNYRFDNVRLDGIFVGFILWCQFEDVRYIEHLAKEPEFRGKGYGKKIVFLFK